MVNQPYRQRRRHAWSGRLVQRTQDLRGVLCPEDGVYRVCSRQRQCRIERCAGDKGETRKQQRAGQLLHHTHRVDYDAPWSLYPNLGLALWTQDLARLASSPSPSSRCYTSSASISLQSSLNIPSMSAIQSSKHFSCATSEQAQGDRHSEVVSSSSVSSLKQIQHLRGSSSSCSCGAVLCCGASLCLLSAACACGEFRRSVCESTEAAEKLLLRVVSSWCEDDEASAGGDGLRCDAGRWGGRDAIVVR